MDVPGQRVSYTRAIIIACYVHKSLFIDRVQCDESFRDKVTQGITPRRLTAPCQRTKVYHVVEVLYAKQFKFKRRSSTV